jgi:hypothetical protein
MHIVISLSKKKGQLKALFLSDTFAEAESFVQDLKSIKVNSETINITAVRKFPPGENDHDGYYLVHDDFSADTYNLYSKRTIINKGYFYNSAELEIKEIMNITITSCTSNSKQNITHVSLQNPQHSVTSSIINPFNQQSGNLINRSVYNNILRQMLEKVNKKNA